MSAPIVTPHGDQTSLLGKLMASVRPEFRADVLVFPADDPVFGGGACQVEGCPRSARGRGLCPGHLQRWAAQGRPDLAVFAASTDPRWLPGGTVNSPTRLAGLLIVVTARPAAACVSSTLSGGNALAAPI